MDSTYGCRAHFHELMDCAPKEPSRVRGDEIVLGKARCEAKRSKTGGRGGINNQETSIAQPQMPLENIGGVHGEQRLVVKASLMQCSQ